MPVEADARLAAALDLVQRLVQDPSAPRALADDARGWLESAGMTRRDAEALAAMPARRLLLYRTLVRRSVESAIRTEIPRIAARLGDVFDEYVERFLDEELPTSHYLRDVAFELVRWALPRWRDDDRVPAWAADLARHELVAFEAAGAFEGEASQPGGVSSSPARSRTSTETRGDVGDARELELERAVSFDRSARVIRYEHAVHELSEDVQARDEPARRPTALFAYRDAAHEVRYLDMTPLAAAVVERLLGGETLRGAVVGACDALGQPVTSEVLAGTARLLADLGERGAIRGAA